MALCHREVLRGFRPAAGRVGVALHSGTHIYHRHALWWYRQRKRQWNGRGIYVHVRVLWHCLEQMAVSVSLRTRNSPSHRGGLGAILRAYSKVEILPHESAACDKHAINKMRHSRMRDLKNVTCTVCFRVSPKGKPM